jgi:hypothetical protein
VALFIMAPAPEVPPVVALKKKNWVASAARERSKLANKEDDWNLNGKKVIRTPPTRTRKGGNGRPNLAIKRIFHEESSSCSSGRRNVDDSESEDSDWTPTNFDSEESDESEEEEGKPAATRVIIESDSVKDLMEKLGRCEQCNGFIEVCLQTVCLATSIVVTCKSPRCGFVCYSDGPAKVNIERPDNRERSTDYAINILYILGFLSSGDGHTARSC